MQTLKSVDYKCNKCGHEQTIVYFLDDQPLPATCCVKCRSGFGDKPYGMFPTGDPVIVHHDLDLVESPIAEAIQ